MKRYDQQFMEGWWIRAAAVVLILGTATCLDSQVGAPPVAGINTLPPLPTKIEYPVFAEKDKPGTELTPDPLKSLLVLASLDGTLTAVDRVSGDTRWLSKDEPMIKVPNGPSSAKAPYFLPDPKTGSLYLMGRKNNLRKLPFTIPQLVAMAPCKNSEGLMYTGKKLDYWLQLNPHTGEKSEILTHGGDSCPAFGDDEYDIKQSCTNSEPLGIASKKSLIIGKTEYTLSMAEGPRKWNVTYHHYSSMDMTPQTAQDYDFVHFTSPSTGTVLTYDRESGQILWQKEIESPVIAVYTVDCLTSNLVSVPFNPIAPETLARLKTANAEENKHLSSTTYIGESNYGLYAVPALVDEMVLLMSGDGGGAQYPPLIEGPPNSQNEKTQHTPPANDESNDFLLLGYYDVPEPTTGGPPMMQIGQSPIIHTGSFLPPGQYNDSHLNGEVSYSTPGGGTHGSSNSNLEFGDPIPLTSPPVTKVPFPPFPFPQKQPTSPMKEVRPIKIVFTTAAISISVTMAMMIFGTCMYRRFHPKRQTQQSEATSESEEIVNKQKKSADGTVVSVGKISFYPHAVLGKGCEGTFVYKGKFEDRDVAVKRILPECFEFADREVDLLKEKEVDQHPNVIRYFCTEADGQFRYIALELCEATLSDWVEGKFPCEYLDALQVLREATDGLAHLHSLRIVHRDIKPANVLISMSGSGGCRARTMISDFGLCKKITNGRMSFSRRSGGIPGTDGWIAPEILKNIPKHSNSSSPPSHRMSYSVDVFSLGCVYYYVLTKGEHPFGEPFRRQSNILSGEFSLEKIQSDNQGIHELINHMISSDASVRPPLSDVLCHPIFWPREKILSFFLDCSDRIEKEDEAKCSLLRRLELEGGRIVRGDWRDHICPEVALDLRKYRTYNGQSIRDLLRALRNKKNHYRELTREAQASLGHIPEEFTLYWISRFPHLLPYTWLIFESVRHEPIFSKYYPKVFSFNAVINGEYCSLLDECEEICDEVDALQIRSESVEKSPKINKAFWRSKSQFKYNKWRRQQQNTNVRENPHNFTSFGTTTYPTSPDSDLSWRNPITQKDNY